MLCLLLVFIFLESCSAQTNEEGIPVASMSAVGFDSATLNKIDTAVRNGTYPNIHSLLIARNKRLVYERYWPGKDEDWGADLGVVTHSKDDLHDIRSISKSVVSACIGIAIQQGKIKSVDQKIFDFFPEYAQLDTGMKTLLTIKHLLTMSSGLSWNEDVPYDNPDNSEIRMTRSPNAVEYVLSQRMDFPPGKVWKYNGGTTQLLAAIIEKTTGKKIDQFASENLFQPLGIKRFQWMKYAGSDLPAAASGLRLRSIDLLKFGLLYHSGGMWNGHQVVPRPWVEESMQTHVERPKGGSYGYQFWLWQDTLNHKFTSIAACVGNGNQRIHIDKTNDLVVVVTAGNYNQWDIKNNSDALVKDFVYAALLRK